MVLGTMYTYDVFAAMPCCQDRVTVSILLVIHVACTLNRAVEMHIYLLLLVSSEATMLLSEVVKLFVLLPRLTRYFYTKT